jgi:hypothetical protein
LRKIEDMFNSAQYDFLEEELWIYEEKYLEEFFQKYDYEEEDTNTEHDYLSYYSTITDANNKTL